MPSRQADDSAGGLIPTHALSWIRQAVSSWETCRSPSVSIIWPHHPYAKGEIHGPTQARPSGSGGLQKANSHDRVQIVASGL